MITSYEVGSIFKIVDEASPTLERLARLGQQVAESIGAAEKSLRTLSRVTFGNLTRGANATADAIARIGAASEETRGVFAQSMESVNAGLLSATRTARELAAAMGEVAGMSRAMAVATAAGGVGGRGGGGGRQGLHVRGMSVGVPGAHAYIHAGNNAAMLGAGALAYGVYEETQFEDAAFRAMFTAQEIPTDPAERAARVKQLRDMVQSASARTGMPIHDIEEATLTGIRQFAGMPWDQRMQVMPELLMASAAEAKLKGKGTTTEAGMESLTSLAHMIKQYKPEQIANLASKFAYISTVDPERLQSIERAASYAVPIMQSGLNVDPFETLLLVAAMQRGGARQSKAGTWIRNMAINAMPGTSLMSRVAFKKHEEALRALGLVDAKDQPTWFTDGKPDLIKLLDIAGEHAAGIPLTRRAAYEKQLFGLQGFGGFAMLSDPTVRQQVHTLQEGMGTFRTGASFFTQYQEQSPGQQFRVAWAELTNVLMDLGNVVLPPLTDGLKSLRDILKGVSDYVPHLGGATPAMGSGVLKGAAAGAGVGWAIGAFGGPIGMAGGAALGGLIGGGIGLLNWQSDPKNSPWLALDASMRTVGNAPPAVGTNALAGSGLAANMARAQQQQITVKVDGDISVNKESVIHEIAAKLADMIAHATEHNAGQGDGVLSSPFTSGAAYP